MTLSISGYAIFSATREIISDGTHQECLKDLDFLLESDPTLYKGYYVDRIPSDIEEFELSDSNEREINFEDIEG